METSSTVAYRPAPNVSWAVETDGIILTDGNGQVCKVGYPEAAVWDLMSRGYRFAKLVVMMGHIAAIETEDAQCLVLDTLQNWTTAGFLIQGT